MEVGEKEWVEGEKLWGKGGVYILAYRSLRFMPFMSCCLVLFVCHAMREIIVFSGV